PRAPLLLLISLVRIRLQAAYRGLWAASLLSLPQTLRVLQRLQLRLGPKRLDRDWVLNGPATGAMQNRHLPRSAPESVQDQGHPLALAGAARLRLGRGRQSQGCRSGGGRVIPCEHMRPEGA